MNGNIIDFKDAYYHIPKNPVVPIQSSSVWSIHCFTGIHNSSHGNQTDPSKQGYKNPLVPRQLLVFAKSHQTCLHQLQTAVAMCQELGLIVNMEKSELEPKQIFDYVGYQFNLKEGQVRPTLEHWQTLNLKIQKLLLNPFCRVKHLVSLISLVMEL